MFALESFLFISLVCSREILRDCSIDRLAVEKNDIIILSSDGLWNVIKSAQMQQIINQNHNQVCTFSSMNIRLLSRF